MWEHIYEHCMGNEQIPSLGTCSKEAQIREQAKSHPRIVSSLVSRGTSVQPCVAPWHRFCNTTFSFFERRTNAELPMLAGHPSYSAGKPGMYMLHADELLGSQEDLRRILLIGGPSLRSALRTDLFLQPISFHLRSQTHQIHRKNLEGMDSSSGG